MLLAPPVFSSHALRRPRTPHASPRSPWWPPAARGAYPTRSPRFPWRYTPACVRSWVNCAAKACWPACAPVFALRAVRLDCLRAIILRETAPLGFAGAGRPEVQRVVRGASLLDSGAQRLARREAGDAVLHAHALVVRGPRGRRGGVGKSCSATRGATISVTRSCSAAGRREQLPRHGGPACGDLRARGQIARQYRHNRTKSALPTRAPAAPPLRGSRSASCGGAAPRAATS